MGFFHTMKTKIWFLSKPVMENRVTDRESGPGNQEGEGEDRVVKCLESIPKNLLVATHESRFSEDMISYALEMAKRMGYGIVAVNAANITHDVTEFFSTSHDRLFSEFKKSAVQNAQEFRSRAKAQGLEFDHSVQFSHMDLAIENITKECGEIVFIISENKESARARGVIGNEKRIAQRLCVYSMD